MKQHVMIDLETMGVGSNAVILSIGACVFGPATNMIGDTFYKAIDFEDACANGEITPSTVKWWMGQSEAARQAVLAGTEKTPVVLKAFTEWMVPLNALAWGNGADFDNVILMNLYRRQGLIQPWGTYNNRCFRTLKNIVGTLPPGGTSAPPPQREGTAHNALDDAVYQAKLACYYAKQYSLTLK